MAEGGTRPVAAKLYESPASEDTKGASTYTPPGAPMQLLGGPNYSPRANAERNTDQVNPTATSVPPVGSSVVHGKSGQRGTVTGHAAHGYSGTAVPQVTWEGEEKSWPQGVSANALRVAGSNPSELYSRNPAPDSPGSDSAVSYTRATGAL